MDNVQKPDSVMLLTILLLAN